MSTKVTKAPPEAPIGIKVSDLAKELGYKSGKELLPIIEELKMPRKIGAAKGPINQVSHYLDEGQAERVRTKVKNIRREHPPEPVAHPAKGKKGAAHVEAPGAPASAPRASAHTLEAIAEETVTAVEPVDFVAEAAKKEAAAVVAAAAAEAEKLAAEAQAAELALHPEPLPEIEPEPEAPPPAEEKPKVQSRYGSVRMPAPPAVQSVVSTVPLVQSPGAPPVHPASALLSGPPRKVLTGPEVAPPIQRISKSDPRFGVVLPAAEAEKLHGPSKAPAAPRKSGQPVQVESKAVEDFKPQVSYPTLPEAAAPVDEDDRVRGRGLVALRRGPGRVAPGLKGFSTGPRRGVALLREEGDRHRGGRRPKQRHSLAPRPSVQRIGPAEILAPVTIKGLCEALGIKATALIKKFFEQGKMVSINTVLPDADAEIYALEFDPLKFGIVIKKARDIEEEMLKKAELADKPADLKPRGPVVTIMGHVDHGKTSLLDHIRTAKVAAGEAGGITQHIGAYTVKVPRGEITFIDTPGHKAFTEMRARGANVTDVVVLVVAANDGVMPQTEEAISHARLANKRIVVAMNKIDLPEANPEKVKAQLAAKELFVEGYGGDAGCVAVSAKTGQGVDELLERILLEAEMLELKANPDKPAAGTVLEAHKDQGRGIVCTLLVQEGTLHAGDIIIAGHAYGSVRQIFSDTGQQLDDAGPAMPVLVTGLSDVPFSGERFHVLDSIKAAAEIGAQRAMRLRQEGLVRRTHVTLETLSDMLAQGAVASLRLVLKVDVMGSLVPLRNAVSELSTSEVRVDLLHDGVGAINETDVLLADASDGIVIGFGVQADPGARRLAEERSVEIRTYDIIYEVVDDMRKALEGLLKPLEREVVQGHATVRQLFKSSKMGTIAGCYVTDGLLQRSSLVRLTRDGKTAWSGKIDSLRREKDDAKEVRSGFECGIKLEKFDDVKQGDVIEAYTTEQVKRTLETK